jgi:hypothetical protein
VLAHVTPGANGEGQRVALSIYIARRIRRFALTLMILVAPSSVWFFANFDLDQCAEQRRLVEQYDRYAPMRYSFPPPQVCHKNDLFTSLERVVTGRELSPLASHWFAPQAALTGVGRSAVALLYAVPYAVLGAALAVCVAILAVDAWLRKRRN